MRADQLGVQAHCLRQQIAASGFDPVAARVRALGIAALELVCFPGCRGNPWGDFGASTDLAPQEIAASLDRHDLACPSVMVSEAELQPARIDETVAWVQGVGCRYITLGAFAHSANPSMADWQLAFARVAAYAESCHHAGLQLVLHTQPDLWAWVDGQLPAEKLLQALDPKRVLIEFDPSGAIIYGHDPGEFITERPEVFYALHLRDGLTPAQPVFYLAAEPLGRGGVDWARLLGAAATSSMAWYILEMEVSEPANVNVAIADSIDYLCGQGHLQPLR